MIDNSMMSGFRPEMLTQKLDDKFQSADADNNGEVSKSEFSTVLSEKGVTESKIDKLFSHVDTDGSGSVSLQEHEDQVTKIQERAEQFMSSNSSGGALGFDPIESLMSSLSNDEDDSLKAKFKETLESVKSGGVQTQVQLSAMQDLASMFPKISEKV